MTSINKDRPVQSLVSCVIYIFSQIPLDSFFEQQAYHETEAGTIIAAGTSEGSQSTLWLWRSVADESLSQESDASLG